MRNVTVTMDDEVARWARIEAARREISVARLLGELLRQEMERQGAYERAMRDFLSTPPQGGSGGEPLPTREEAHDRAALR